MREAATFPSVTVSALLAALVINCTPPADPAPRDAPEPAPQPVAPPPTTPPSPQSAPPLEPACHQPLQVTRVPASTVPWTRVGTAGPALELFGIDGAAVITAGPRTYIVAADEQLRDDPARRRGLSKRPIVWAGGRWPTNAWVVTDEGLDSTVEGSDPPHRLFPWRWTDGRWARPTPRPVRGDVQEIQAELLTWDHDELLRPLCDQPANIRFDHFGASELLPLDLPFRPGTIHCPRLFYTAGNEGFFAPDFDESRGTPKIARWCRKCDGLKVERLALRRCEAAPIDRALLGRPAAQRGDRIAFIYHTARVRPDVPGSFIGAESFVVLVDGDTTTVELAPPDGLSLVTSLSYAPGGDLWLTEGPRLWRRLADGTWTLVMPPDDAKRIEQVLAVSDTDVWLVTSPDADGDGPRALDRLGTHPGEPLALDRG